MEASEHVELEEIGEGSFGKVFRIRDSKLGWIAVKKIKTKDFSYEKEQVVRESEIMMRCDHPNLVRIYDSHFDEKEGELTIRMEYCEKGDLVEFIKSQGHSLSLSEKMKIFAQIVAAFIYLNVRGVIHRDLKPENILICQDSNVKVSDFGCARVLNSNQMSVIDSYSIDKGTLNFVSPEQLCNDKYSAKCDVWAGGCLLYLLVFGEHPFLNKGSAQIINCIKALTFIQPLKIPPNCDSAIARALSLTLVYADKERASWRELWLSRLFAPRLSDVTAFVDYLRNLACIANWFTKEFWRAKGEVAKSGRPIDERRAQTLVYFLTKFQASAMHCALSILNKHDDFEYLFDEGTYANFKYDSAQSQDIFRLMSSTQNHFSLVKLEIQRGSCRDILEKDFLRQNCFADLDVIIRVIYKIFRERTTERGPNEPVFPSSRHCLWLNLARFLNFEHWFAFESNPRLEKILVETPANLHEQLKQEIEDYELGRI